MSDVLMLTSPSRYYADRERIDAHQGEWRGASGWVAVYAVTEKWTVAALADRITVNPDQCGGRPCVRGMRIRVTDVLDLLASNLSPEQVLEELPSPSVT